MPPTAVAPPPEPSDVGIVAALPIEVAPLLARFEETRKYSGERHTIIEGLLAGKLVTLITTGPGRMSARRGAALLLAGHHPRWVLSVGFAGSLQPRLKRNAVVLPDALVEPEGDVIRVGVESLDADNFPERGLRMATVDGIVRTASEKASLRERTGADLVDMETTAVARLCAERGTRFLAVRVVSDESDVDLPPEVLTIMGPTGGYRVGAAIGAIWKRPGSVKDLLRLRDHAHEAAGSLAEAVTKIISELP